LLQERVTERRWTSELDQIKLRKPDSSILKAFLDAVAADMTLTATVRSMAGKAASGANDKDFLRGRRELIGRLRGKLAAAGVKAVASSCLIIVDEFQKFSQLLRAPREGATMAQQLADRLFRYGEAGRRVLLLSATPYRLPGTRSDGDEKPYDSFVDLIAFMAGETVAESLDHALADFAAGLQSSQPDPALIEAARGKAQSILSNVMTRTERVSWTRDADSMVSEQFEPLAVEVDDFKGGITARLAARLIKAQDPVEYWKSAPFFLDFMREYQFRKLAMATQGKERSTLARLARGTLLLDQAALRRHQESPIPNARLRFLIDDALPAGAERLLWVPPSLPYLEPAGPFAGADADLKRLVFSEWRLAPDAIAAMTSYEAERRLSVSASAQAAKKRKRGAKPRDAHRAHADFAKHGELLRLTRSDRQKSRSDHHPAALALLVPSQRLATLGDPLAFALEHGEPVAPTEALDKISRSVAKCLKSLPKGATKGRIDERWYWAAPLLLDGPGSIAWLRTHDPLGQRMERGARAIDQGLELNLVPGMLAILAHPTELGARPRDLVKVLAALAIAGPAVCALRAISRNFATAELPSAARQSAFHVARGFQTLFNQSDATLAVQSHRRKGVYWRQVLGYALDGNIQALLDEQLHLSAEALSLYEGTTAAKMGKAAVELFGALTLRRAVVEVSGLERRRGRSKNVESVSLRCRHALRFAEIKEPEGGVSRLDAVRSAFNSPFRPFVLASTTVGQEGLDFHPWCHAVVHWNLPQTPVELEQREGRVHRYKGHAVRLNVADEIGLSGLRGSDLDADQDPWRRMFALAAEREPDNELAPSWLFEGSGKPRRIRRIVPLLELSREAEYWPRLRARLGIYRLVMGLPRQEDLLSALEGRVTAAQARAWAIDLRPPASIN
jgi:hypothetical protein